MNYYPVCRCGVSLDDTNYENGQCDKCANADYAKYKLLEAVEHAEIINTSTANVYLLPTNNEPTEDDILLFGNMLIQGSRISIPNDTVGFINPVDNKFISISGIKRFKPQHIYVTVPQSDLAISTINVGDWFIANQLPHKLLLNIGGEYPYRVINRISCTEEHHSKLWNTKIIATTDTSLRSPFGCQEIVNTPHNIQQAFIEYFIAEYNHRNAISQVEVVTERGLTGERMNTEFFTRLKVNQQNEIYIAIPNADGICQNCDIIRQCTNKPLCIS